MRLLLFLSLFLLQSSAPDSNSKTFHVSEALIAGQTIYFELQDNQFTGAEALLAALDEAQFVALGELHNRVRLGELTESLLHVLEPRGFSHLAIETGPYSAQKLQYLIRKGKSEVIAFYEQYSSGLFKIVPIPFFEGKSDLKFLSAADSLGYQLWGLDQEFYFSYTFLIDELARLAGESTTVEQQQLRKKLIRRLYWLDRRNQISDLFTSGFQRSCKLKEDEELKVYLDSFENIDHPEIRPILDSFRTTLEIYCLAEQGKASEPVRINYFKENFDLNYQTALVETPEPKVFIKMGSFHSGRQLSPLNLYDIGNHIHRLAESQDQTSVHIYYLNRFFDGEDMTGRQGWESSEKFMSAGDRNKWALTDLRPLREQLLNETLHGTDWEMRVIRNYDFIIIPPEDNWISRHW